MQALHIEAGIEETPAEHHAAHPCGVAISNDYPLLVSIGRIKRLNQHLYSSLHTAFARYLYAHSLYNPAFLNQTYI